MSSVFVSQFLSDLNSLSTVPTTTASSPTSSASASASATKNHSGSHLTTAEIVEVVIVSLGFFILLVLVATYSLALCRPRKKSQHSDERYKCVDTLESPAVSKKLSQDDWPSDGKTAAHLTTHPQRSLDRSSVFTESQYWKDAYTLPSPFVNDYERLEAQEPHSVPLNNPHSPRDTEQFDTATLHSARSSSWNSTVKLPPLSIPQRPLYYSSGRGSIKRNGSRHSSKTIDSEDSVSLYSEASAYTPTPTSPPVLPIPIHVTQPTSPDTVDVVGSTSKQEENIIKSPPTASLSASLALPKLNGDEAEEDEIEIHNVAKLLYSRRSKELQSLDTPSRNTSIVSHIERSGSIKPAILSPVEEESEPSRRPRYLRSKQKRNADAPATLLRASSVSTLPSPYSPDSPVGMGPS